MTLADILRQLQAGELAFLKVGELDTKEEQAKVLQHVNLALTDLHTRLQLRRGTVDIKVLPEIEIYEIHSKRGVYWGSESICYLLDFPDAAFPDNVIKIERIYSKQALEKRQKLHQNRFNIKNCSESKAPEELPLNDFNRPDSFHELSNTTVRIPPSYPYPTFSVDYRANHQVLSLDDCSDICKIEIDLSMAFMEPLLLFIAHRAVRTLNSDGLAEQNNYYQMYEAAIQRLINLSQDIGMNSTNLKLDCNGWV